MSSGSFTSFESEYEPIAFRLSIKASFVGTFHGFSRGALAFEKPEGSPFFFFFFFNNGLFAALLINLDF
jgi:hypothetical protein